MEINQKKLDFIKTLPTEKPLPEIRVMNNGIEKVGRGAIEIDGTIVGTGGFGWEWDGEKHIEFPHHGGVKFGEDVVIGNNTCIDRASLAGEFTEIGDGTKIDNLVHIAHNVKIGKHCLIVAGSVIGGSVVIGDRCYIGIGAMIKQKVKIGNDVTVGMGAVVLRDIPDGETWAGNPAKKLEK